MFPNLKKKKKLKLSFLLLKFTLSNYILSAPMEQVTCHHFQGAKPSSLKCRNPLSNFTSDDPFLIFNLSHVPLHSVASTNYTAPPSLAIHIEYTQVSSKETSRPNGFTELPDKWTHYLVRANLPVLTYSYTLWLQPKRLVDLTDVRIFIRLTHNLVWVTYLYLHTDLLVINLFNDTVG